PRIHLAVVDRGFLLSSSCFLARRRGALKRGYCLFITAVFSMVRASSLPLSSLRCSTRHRWEVDPRCSAVAVETMTSPAFDGRRKSVLLFVPTTIGPAPAATKLAMLAAVSPSVA